jgi:hypothetical protein
MDRMPPRGAARQNRAVSLDYRLRGPSRPRSEGQPCTRSARESKRAGLLHGKSLPSSLSVSALPATLSASSTSPAHQNRVAAGRVGRGSSCGGPRRALFYGGTESSNPPRSRRESTANLLRAADDAKKCSDHRPKTSDPALYGSGPTSVLKHTWWHAPMTSSFVGGAPGVWLAVRSGFWRKVAGVQRTGLRGRLSHCNALAHAHLPLGTRVLSSRFNGA